MIRNAKLFSALLLAISLNVACGDGKNSDEQSLTSAETSSLPACQITAGCNQVLPTLPKAKGFNSIYNKVLTKLGKPLHRGRDIIVTPGAPVWIQAKFTYGLLDSDLHHENIDIYLSQGCNSPMKKIGYGFTSNDGENDPIDGVEDSGGRIYVNLATLGINNLPIGRHRVVLVVQGDNSMTELYITVVDPRQKIAVADIDGTLTQSELAAAVDVLGGQAPARPNAVAAIKTLVSKGYHILYLTARPEWLGAETRKWLSAQGFPVGTIRTTDSKVGANGTPATAFKLQELELLIAQTGIVPEFAIGNKDTDVAAYVQAGIPAAGSYYHDLASDLEGGTQFNDYSSLVADFQATAKVCQ
jgi:phosphatidate phosphatase PAH1